MGERGRSGMNPVFNTVHRTRPVLVLSVKAGVRAGTRSVGRGIVIYVSTHVMISVVSGLRSRASCSMVSGLGSVRQLFITYDGPFLHRGWLPRARLFACQLRGGLSRARLLACRFCLSTPSHHKGRETAFCRKHMLRLGGYCEWAAQ